jgi:hypothetical protein
LRAFQTRSGLTLELSLVSGEERIPISEVAVTMAGQNLEIKGPTIPIQDPSLIPRPGAYCLVASLGHRDIATFPFRVVGREELLCQVKLTGLRVDAEGRGGQILRGIRALHWEEHRACFLSLQVETGIAAPNSSFRCVAQMLHEEREVWRQDFILHLDYLCQQIRLPRIELRTLGNIAKSKPARLTFSVTADGETKHTSAVIILPTERITNFEGQLCLDPEDLALEEAEYTRIATHLGVIPERPRRWFHRRTTV